VACKSPNRIQEQSTCMGLGNKVPRSKRFNKIAYACFFGLKKLT